VQLFDSWAGALTRDEYRRFALPATERVIAAVADLDVPTILFGVGTGELLDLMSSANSSVMGIDWHVTSTKDDDASADGPSRATSILRAVSAASIPPLRVPGTFSFERATRPGTSSTWATASCPRPIGGPRSDRPRRARRGNGGRSMTTGVLVMAYGTPTTPADVEAYYTRIRHGRPPRPSSSPISNAATTPSGARHPSPSAAPTKWPVSRRRSNAVSRAASTCASDRNTNHRFSRRPPNRFAAKVSTSSWDWSSHPTRHRCRPTSTCRAPERPLGGDVEFIEIGAWWEFPGFLEIIAGRVNDALSTIPVDRRATTEVLFSAHSLPEKILATGDTYPDQLRESAERAAALAGVEHWDVAWQSAGRTPDPWIGPDILQVLRDKRGQGVTDVVSCPIGFVSDHLEVLSISTSRHRALHVRSV